MRILFDTNVAILVTLGQYDEMSPVVLELINHGYENQFYISSISVIEIIHLHLAKKIDNHKKRKFATPNDLILSLDPLFSITVKHFGMEHALTQSKLIAAPNHNDPFDRAIIAHAITENLVLVSSDLKFPFYIPQGLDLIENR